MARPSEHTFGYEVLNSSPSIYGAEVSAEWKRTRKGEVIMTVRMPHDADDSEVYIKTPRGHSGILMDPLDILNLEKEMEQLPQPLTKSQKTSSTDSTKKGLTSTSAYTRLLVDRSSSETAICLPCSNRKQNPHAYGLIADHPSGR